MLVAGHVYGCLVLSCGCGQNVHMSHACIWVATTSAYMDVLAFHLLDWSMLQPASNHSCDCSGATYCPLVLRRAEGMALQLLLSVHEETKWQVKAACCLGAASARGTQTPTLPGCQ